MKIDEPVQKFCDDYQLTRQQVEYIQLLAEGLCNKEIAEERGVKKKSVDRALSIIYNKTNMDGSRAIMSEIYKIALEGK